MKSRTWAWLLSILFLLCLGLSLPILFARKDATAAEIWSDNRLVATVDLHIDQEITVRSENGTNVVTVRGGKIAVTRADCPDHYCMQRGFCSGGTQIVCLPNRLVIRFIAESDVDGAVG